ncbi:hypothetical protein PR048_013822 [Dryococelus australis]|uniref:Uncharacterized protein n=1 Tax=Dryococelus australis TaxID=614101 RepID=A0ABQ9HU29_9NEOP|nr:hypothetical protein PR048_013822 [Dryococelus australis]
MDVEKWVIKGKTVGTINKGQENQKGQNENISKEMKPQSPSGIYSFTAFSCEVTSKGNIFILDLGATSHLVIGSLEEYMSVIRTLPHSVVIKTANGK